MITVNCADVLPIQHSLMIYVADRVEVIPASKNEEFALSPIEHDDKLADWQVILAIEEYLGSIGKKDNFSVVSESKTIFIKSKNGEKIKGKAPSIPTATQRSYVWEALYRD
jgi:hypothetical protein